MPAVRAALSGGDPMNGTDDRPRLVDANSADPVDASPYVIHGADDIEPPRVGVEFHVDTWLLLSAVLKEVDADRFSKGTVIVSKRAAAEIELAAQVAYQAWKREVIRALHPAGRVL